ncbi:Bug family tripartite tricarboxylate transporter substrate binding protein [Hydrogenophaga sp. BPS33]|uniref:Bug family tripartite tricarboxylate transporter substrate binding protein n=1 Tax=Hydrogenophaga sp. BPS33 TaxID=2651974 RepID=UPI00135B0EFA|nr:tripartite tricarboxylate transporter substrate binding protein [Hydrogenophaga sp. BPS33]
MSWNSICGRVAACALLGMVALWMGQAHAQDFPSRPIKILIGFAPGGGSDLIARLYAQHLRQELNTPVIVENKAGASELQAVRALIASPPDGYTLWLAAGGALSIGPGIRKDLPYEPLTSLSHVAMVATAPGVFYVNPALPVRSVSDFVAYAQANPGKVNFSSSGVGSGSHLQVEYFMQGAGIKMTHIPYKSSPEAAQSVVSGEVQFGLAPAQTAIPLANDGRVRAIAVTNTRRLPALPNVPTMAEAGSNAALKSMDGFSYYALVGPANMPSAVIQKINQAFNKVGAMPEVVEHMRDRFSVEPVTTTPAAFREYLEKDLMKWKEVGKTVKIDG